MTMITTGDELVAAFPGRHPHNRECPVCNDPVTTVAIVNLAYTFEAHDCEAVEYTHLVETLYHRACLEPTRCETFTPFHVRGRSHHLAYDTLECRVCGRTEASHR